MTTLREMVEAVPDPELRWPWMPLEEKQKRIEFLLSELAGKDADIEPYRTLRDELEWRRTDSKLLHSLPMPEDLLRILAKAHGSVNVDLATYHELRWHDPYFLTLHERWNIARIAWKNEWYERMPHKLWGLIGDVHNPNHEALPEPHGAVAREFIEARKLYLDAINHYGRGVGGPS